MLSLAGGWFYLNNCETGAMGTLKFRLPGIGSYMQAAIDQWNVPAMVAGVCAMIILIVGIDFVITRPILAWVQRFRLEEVPGGQPEEPLMQLVYRHSRIIRWAKVIFKRSSLRKKLEHASTPPVQSTEVALSAPRAIIQKHQSNLSASFSRFVGSRSFELLLLTVLAFVLAVGCGKLFGMLSGVRLSVWVLLARNTFWTFLRVLASVVVSTLWTVPVGIWIAMSAKRVRFFQPIIQVMASFPAPMLYPLAVMVLFKLGVRFDIVAGLLMFLGVQWYVLFNVLAGALRIPLELKYALDLMEASRLNVWRRLYVPSIFPALVTGWVTAAGGAWNASIVAEILSFQGHELKTAGLGATITAAETAGDFPLMAASLTVMVIVVVLLNRTLWAKLYRSAQTRFRMDLA